MEFAAIDFETATAARDSACSVAVSKLTDGKLNDAFYSLIKPRDLRFSYQNIQIHGIRPQDVYNKPDFAAVWPSLVRELEGKVVVAHNAAFDMSVLRACLRAYALPPPRFDYFCTVKLARRLWPELENHRLNTLGAHFGIAFQHHNALADARTCAQIAYLAMQKMQSRDLYELGVRLCVRPTPFKL